MIITCPADIAAFIVKNTNFFQNLLNNGPPSTITKAILIMMQSPDRVDYRQTIFDDNVKDVFVHTAGVLGNVLQDKFNYQLGNIDLFLATKSHLEDNIHRPQFSSKKKLLDDCMANANCTEADDFRNVLTTKPFIMDISSHPVHIQDVDGKLNPSAFIPFCIIGK